MNEFIDANKDAAVKKVVELKKRIAKIGVRMCMKMVRNQSPQEEKEY